MSSLHSRYRYFSICDFSSKGSSEAAYQSRILRNHLKGGRSQTIERLFNTIIDMELEEFGDFFNSNISLIPVPRSHKQVRGALWPAEVIAKTILGLGYAKETLPVIERVINVNTSSLSSPQNRPSVQEHINSLAVADGVIFPSKVVLVDDVITQGRTLVACALKILEKHPTTEIKCFAIMKTRHFVEDIPSLISPTFNHIDYFQSGKTFRQPQDD